MDTLGRESAIFLFQKEMGAKSGLLQQTFYDKEDNNYFLLSALFLQHSVVEKISIPLQITTNYVVIWFDRDST